MFSAFFFAPILLALTVVAHTLGAVILFRWVLQSHVKVTRRFWTTTWFVIRLAWSLIALHLVEIAVWALFFWSQRCTPDLESAFYFSGATYTTVGYGDLLLPKEWRLMGPIEGLTGILMCGLSTGFFFAVVTRLYAAERKAAVH